MHTPPFHIGAPLRTPPPPPPPPPPPSFWDRIAEAHLIQAREVVLSCLKGYPPELALKASNPISAPPVVKRKAAAARVTSEQLHNMKHDVAYLKKAQDLKSVNSVRYHDNEINFQNTKPRYLFLR